MVPRGKAPGRVKPEDEKQPMGRPRKQPPTDAAEVITAACSVGASKAGVAMALGVNADVLSRWLDERADLKQAFDEGRETERKTLHSVLYEAATKGTGKDALIAAMFLLKSRHGYREGDQEGYGNRVSVTFNIPGAQPLSQFMTIENENNRTESLPRAITRSS